MIHSILEEKMDVVSIFILPDNWKGERLALEFQ